MAYLVIATAGHVDHGKTTLIKALTGMETDTTKEEKKRGLSINLGFAYLDLPDGQRVGIVDVPGHERFIKNMVAGLPGINLVLLVIDAGEGVMPQTREHIDILTVLGVREFIIVLTKVDAVDAELQELAREDIREQLSDTVLKDAEIVETDAVSGKGIELLKLKIQEWAEKHPAMEENGEARMNIDRSFSVKGFGTVVTGTLLDGSLSVGDELYVYPGLVKTKVRNIQIHEQNVKVAGARHRTALNLTNIGLEEIQRGDVVSVSPLLKGSWMLDVKVQCLKNSPLAMGLWNRVRVLVGTREVMARIVPIGTELIQPGGEGFLQLRMEEEVFVKNGDRFVLRSYSPMTTIGGGEVLDAAPRKHRRFHQDVLDSLKTKEEGNLDDIISDFLCSTPNGFASMDDLSLYVHMPKDEIDDTVQRMIEEGLLLPTPAGYLHREVYKSLRGKAVQLLLTYHRKYPLRPGMALEEFRSRLQGNLQDKAVSALLTLLTDEHACRMDGKYMAAASFAVTLSPAQKRQENQLLQRLEQAGFTPMKLDDIETIGPDVVEIARLGQGKQFIFLTPEYVIAKKTYDAAVDIVYQYLNEHGKMTLGDFRDATQSSRKSSMLILEYIDARHITAREDNYRIFGPAADRNRVK